MGTKSLTWTYMVEMMGLEPTTPCLQSRCSSQLSYIPGCQRNWRLIYRNGAFPPGALRGITVPAPSARA
jgi:hypothetical protein